MEWLPIETAPKDGTRILVGREGYPRKSGKTPVNVVRWMRVKHGSQTSTRKVWHLARGVQLPYAPTHWMPLPSPPRGENKCLLKSKNLK